MNDDDEKKRFSDFAETWLIVHIKTKIKFTRTITAECTENQKEKMFVFFQLFAKKGHPPTGEIKR